MQGAQMSMLALDLSNCSRVYQCVERTKDCSLHRSLRRQVMDCHSQPVTQPVKVSTCYGLQVLFNDVQARFIALDFLLYSHLQGEVPRYQPMSLSL